MTHAETPRGGMIRLPGVSWGGAVPVPLADLVHATITTFLRLLSFRSDGMSPTDRGAPAAGIAYPSEVAMSLASEFKAFVLRGNVVDLAVGVIIGAAFGAIVSSLVSDVLMPPIGWATGGVNFGDKAINLPGSMIDPATKDLPPEKQKMVPVKIRWGAFFQRVVDFLIIASVLFVVIQAMNRLKKKEEEKPPEPTATEKLLAEIRDELRKRPA